MPRGNPLRVGIVGCGRIVQTVHAPTLADIPAIKVTAVCDIEDGPREAVGARLGAEHRCGSWEELVSRPDVDAVLVATPEHVGPSIGALQAGKHLLVEKPLSLDIGGGMAIVDAAESSGTVAMLGYMKRYDWCFQRACELIGQLPKICMTRVHDFACAFDKTDYLFDVIPPRVPRSGAHLRPVEALLMFASHDFSVVRGAVGHPEEVVHVHGWGDRTLCAEIRCHGDRICLLELSLDTRYEWFDETITVYGEQEELGVRFADPFVPFGRSTVWRRHGDEHAVRDEITTGPFEDAFRREWLHFVDCIESGRRPLTPLADGLADIELAEEIAGRLVAESTTRE